MNRATVIARSLDEAGIGANIDPAQHAARF